MELKERIDKSRLPRHIAIIMDGNGRWAKEHGEMRIIGHANGVEAVREALVAASEIGVEYLTLYAFSTENWNRPKEEIDALMDLLVNTIVSEVKSLNENGVRLSAIGDLNSLPENCRNVLKKGIADTANNDRITLNLALSYSSRWEITNAMQVLAEQVKNGELEPEQIDEDRIDEALTTKGIPDPELLIRTSGEQRISNFILWQLAYTDLYFTPTLWPDFDQQALQLALQDFAGRQRRFGYTGDQIESLDQVSELVR